MIDTHSWTSQPVEVILRLKEAYLSLCKIHRRIERPVQHFFITEHDIDHKVHPDLRAVVRGFGPRINLKNENFFSHDLLHARHSVAKSINQNLRGFEVDRGAVFLDLHYQIDGDANCFGDFCWHRFAIYKHS